jgi:hypothetical protein
MQEDMQGDGYVECSECGHIIDGHDEEGCSDCTCVLPWTRQRIRAYYRTVGVAERTGTIKDWDLS